MTAGAGYRLVALECGSCGAALSARGLDVVYYCTACRNGYRFDAAEERLMPLEVGFVSAPNVAAEMYRPFWVLPAAIEIRRREALGGGIGGLLSLFLSGPEESGMPSGEGRFAVPAFHTSVGALVDLTRRYSPRVGDLDLRLGERLLGGRYSIEDARKLAHFALISGEVEKPDTLKNLSYSLRFEEPRLLGVPFVRKGERWVDGLFGIAV